jgi:hypothetical protein
MLGEVKLLLSVTPAVFIVVPHTKNNHCFRMDRIPDNIFPEYGVPEGIRIGRQLDSPPHFREKTKNLQGLGQFVTNTLSGRRILFGNKGAEAVKVGNRLFGIS